MPCSAHIGMHVNDSIMYSACHENLSWPVLFCLPAILVSRDNLVVLVD